MKDAVDTQNTATSLKSQNIDGAKIQWGTDTSSKADEQTFHFPEHFDTSNVAVIVNRSIANADATLAIVEVTDSKYKINRADTISGDGQTFNMLAVGGNRNDRNYARIKDANGQDIALVQWGTFVTDTDKDQTFDFPISFADKCCAVVTNRTERNAHSNLPLTTSADKSSFTINRPNPIQGGQCLGLSIDQGISFIWLCFRLIYFLNIILLDICGIAATPLGGWEVENAKNV